MTDNTLYKTFAGVVEDALGQLVASGDLPEGTTFERVTVEPPRDPSHGDLLTNAAMLLAMPVSVPAPTAAMSWSCVGSLLHSLRKIHNV